VSVHIQVTALQAANEHLRLVNVSPYRGCLRTESGCAAGVAVSSLSFKPCEFDGHFVYLMA
jgi:hypothetical protein